MTPAQKAQQTAYNEFIADYVERHGECKATRDEAHGVADWVVSVAKGVGGIITQHNISGPDDSAADFLAALIDGNREIDGKDDAKQLAECAFVVALEEMK